MEKLDNFTLNLLTNDEVIAIDQDVLGKQATCIETIGDLRIYVKELDDGNRAIGFCNFGSEKVTLYYSDLNKLGLNGRWKVRDLWRQKDVAVINSPKDKLPLSVPAHGVLLYKFTLLK
jgi:alpha-galactosidase